MLFSLCGKICVAFSGPEIYPRRIHLSLPPPSRKKRGREKATKPFPLSSGGGGERERKRFQLWVGGLSSLAFGMGALFAEGKKEKNDHFGNKLRAREDQPQPSYPKQKQDPDTQKPDKKQGS